jgi:hypothetical protein
MRLAEVPPHVRRDAEPLRAAGVKARIGARLIMHALMMCDEAAWARETLLTYGADVSAPPRVIAPGSAGPRRRGGCRAGSIGQARDGGGGDELAGG